jgi:hypothetical protein
MDVLRCKSLENTWRANGNGIGRATIMDYLTAPPGAQLRLSLDEEGVVIQ